MWCVWLRIIKALLTVQISPISTFLYCGIGKRTEIWLLSDTLTGQDPSANRPRGEHDYVSVGAEQKKGVNDSLRLCAASRAFRPMVQTRPDALPHKPAVVSTTGCDADREETGSDWDIQWCPEEADPSLLTASQNTTVEENESRRYKIGVEAGAAG